MAGFEVVLKELKKFDGQRFCRAGWNGKRMWIASMSGLKLPAASSAMPGPKVNERTALLIGKDAPLDSQPYIVMWTAEQKWQPGFLLSQADVFAEDWQPFAG